MHQSYKLYCASDSFMKNQQIRINKVYPNPLKPEFAVSNIVSENLGGSCSFDVSDNDQHIVFSNWNPFVCGWYCAKLAIKSNRADYVFFMKDNNQYCFRSLETMYMTEQSPYKFVMRPMNMGDKTGKPAYDYGTVIQKYHVDHADSLGSINAGYYGSTMNTFNMITKQFEKKEYKFGQDNPLDSIVSAFAPSLMSKATEANISFLPKNPGATKGPNISETVEVWHQSRKSNFLKLEQEKIIIQIPGGGKAWELLGKTCSIEIPSQQDIVSNVIDNFFGGKYFITHVYHNISVYQYVVNIEAIQKRVNLPFSISNFGNLFG